MKFKEKSGEGKSSTSQEGGATRGEIRSLRLLWPWISPHLRQLIYALLAIFLVVFALLGLGRGIAYLVDNGLSQGNGEFLNGAVFICLAFALMLAVGSYLRAVLINRVAERIIANLRKSLFRHALSLSVSWFEGQRAGNVISTISTDTALIQVIVASTLSMALRNILVLIGGILFLILTSPKLTLIILGVIPIVIVPVVILGRRLRAQSRIAQDRLGDISAEAEQALSSIQTIHAFGREDEISQLFNHAAESSHDASVRRLVLRGMMSGVVIFLVFSAITFTLWVGGQDLISGEMSAGALASFVFYAALVASSVGALSDMSGELQRAAGATERITSLLSEKVSIKSTDNPQPLPVGQLGIDFKGVSFSYPARPDLPVLHNFNLTIAPQERVALVGASGAGKSTIFNLILRLNDAEEGEILIGGVNSRDLTITDLRGAIGFVPQEVALFSGTIASNIAFGRPDASMGEIEDAGRQSFADDFIKNLPQGYNTPVGEKGVRLSGGQRQRLSIARAILRNPKILLLDEATSALDAHSEQAVASALENLMTSRTSIVIAHRLATVAKADRIIVLDKGNVVTSGSHDELLETSPLYHDFASLQFMT